jgi:hypothetical protein
MMVGIALAVLEAEVSISQNSSSSSPSSCLLLLLMLLLLLLQDLVFRFVEVGLVESEVVMRLDIDVLTLVAFCVATVREADR